MTESLEAALPPSFRWNPLIAAAVVMALSPPAQSAPDQPTLEAVVVTASRRAQNVTDVPYNMSAVSAKELAVAGVQTCKALHTCCRVTMPRPRDLGQQQQQQYRHSRHQCDQPGLSFLAPNLAAPPVSTYIDDVPLFVNLSTADVERVEVLRGPQAPCTSRAPSAAPCADSQSAGPEEFEAEFSTDAPGPPMRAIPRIPSGAC